MILERPREEGCSLEDTRILDRTHAPFSGVNNQLEPIEYVSVQMLVARGLVRFPWRSGRWTSAVSRQRAVGRWPRSDNEVANTFSKSSTSQAY